MPVVPRGRHLTGVLSWRLRPWLNLLHSVAALRLVEKRSMDLNKTVSVLVSTWAYQEVFYGSDESNRPLIRKRTNATLRSLLAHRSGARYDLSNSALARYTTHKEWTINSGATVNYRSGYPLVFELNTAWEYRTGVHWVKQLIECLTG